MIQLYGMQSPNVRKVGILLEELGLEYSLKHVAVFRGEQFQPEFVQLNPLSKVPVLVDAVRGDGKPVIESGAILLYLAETYGGFLPTGGAARYEVLSWLMVQVASIGPMFGQHNHFQILREQADAYAAARYQNQCESLYRVLDERLSSRSWLAGDDYSIADIATYPWALYLEQHGFDPEQHPHLMRWRRAIEARPAIARSWERFDEAFSAVSTASRRAATAEDLDRFFGRKATAPDVDFSAVTRG